MDGGQGQALAVNDTVTFNDVAPGDHEVEVAGVASNCAVSGNNPRTVTVTSGQTASTSFEVTCSAALRQIAFSTDPRRQSR
jgi:hypothetical protein